MNAFDIADITGTYSHISPLQMLSVLPVKSNVNSQDAPIPSSNFLVLSPVAHRRSSSTEEVSLPPTFLVLAPVQSETYPSSHESAYSVSSKAPSVVSSETSDVSQADIELLRQKLRRSSSVSSSGLPPMRFLKLGPVHFGGLPGETDYADE